MRLSTKDMCPRCSVSLEHAQFYDKRTLIICNNCNFAHNNESGFSCVYIENDLIEWDTYNNCSRFNKIELAWLPFNIAVDRIKKLLLLQ